MKRSNVLLAVLCLLMMSCNPNEDTVSNPPPTTDFTKNFGVSVARDFIGQVVDSNNLPVESATIKIGNTTVQTDTNGVFIVNDTNVYEKFAYITAKKEGYCDGSRAMIPTEGKNNVRIMMIPNTPIATITSGSASEVTLANGTKVVFDGAFETEAGVAYSGSVAVAMFHLKPSDPNTSSLMPGMLYAQATDGSAKVLQTFGMMQVELKGSDGQKLQIAKSHTAQIKMQIDAAQGGTAPSTIPLWHFDEENGYWKQEGSATKVGNQYVGTVSHFSWWNCDAYFSTVNLSAKVLDSNGNPIPNVAIGLIANGSSFPAMGYTDNNGEVSGLIPANQTITLNVYEECGIVYTATIGPFSQNTVLPTITLSSSAVISTKINGTLLKCNGSNVTNGYVVLSKEGGDQLISVTNGAYSFNALFCSGVTSFSLRAVDLDNLQTTAYTTYTIATPVTTVGSLNCCNAIAEYLYYKIDNGPVRYIFANKGGGYNSPSLLFSAWGYDYATGNSLFVIGNTLVPGIYNSPVFSINGIGGPYVYANENITYNLKKLGTIGQPIEMTLAGTYDDNYGVNHTISASISVIRNQ